MWPASHVSAVMTNAWSTRRSLRSSVCVRGETELAAIRRKFEVWPSRQLPEAEIGQALATLFDEAEITAAERIGRLVVVSVSLKDPSMESKIKLEAEPAVSRLALLGNVDIAALR